MTQPEKINLIFAGLSKYFGVSQDKISAPHRSRDSIHIVKKFAIYFMRTHTILSWADIKRELGYRQQNTLKYHYNNLLEDLSEESYGDPRAKKVLEELKEYIPL